MQEDEDFDRFKDIVAQKYVLVTPASTFFSLNLTWKEIINQELLTEIRRLYHKGNIDEYREWVRLNPCEMELGLTYPRRRTFRLQRV